MDEKNLLLEYDKDIIELIEKIWKISNNPYSIYIRGSYANLERKHTPWDLDIYFITTKKEDINIKEISKKLDCQYPNLPILDLTIITKHDLFELEEHILKRLLLIYGSNLVKGKALKNIINQPILNKETSIKIKKIMHKFVFTKITEMELKLNTEKKGNLSFISKKISKMLIRTGVFIGIAEYNVFSRDINYCYENLIKKYPNLKQYIDEIYQVLGGKDIDFSQFLNYAKIIKNTVYHEPEFNT